MGIVGRTIWALKTVPSAGIPRQCLVSGNRTVRQFSNESVDTDFPPVRLVLVPVVAVLVVAQLAVIRPHIALKVGIILPSTVYHDPFRRDLPARLVTGVVGEHTYIEIHKKFPLQKIKERGLFLPSLMQNLFLF